VDQQPVLQFGVEALVLGLHMRSVDVGHLGATSQRHGEFELIPQHLEHLLHARLTIAGQTKHHGPSDLQRGNQQQAHII